MLPFLLAALAAAPLPRAASHSDMTVFIPRLDKLEGAGVFATRAGERSVMLRPSSWSSEFHPLLYLDPTRPASLQAAGIDPTGDATVGWLGDGHWNCSALSDPKLFQSRADARLGSFGVVTRKTEAGAVQVTASASASAGTAMLAGYALKGRYACAFSDPADARVLAADAPKRVQRGVAPPEWQQALSLPGVAFAVSARGTFAVDADATTLTLQTRTSQLPLPTLRSGGSSPFGAAVPSGLLFARAQVDPAQTPQLASMAAAQLLAVCSACDYDSLTSLVADVALRLTGNVMLRVDHVDIKGSLRSKSARYFAARHAYLAEVTEPDEVRRLLARLLAHKGARAAEEGYALAVPGGEVRVGVHGRYLFVANDTAALTAALNTLPARPGRVTHGAEAWVDPRLAARGLRQVSLLDVVGAPDLAALFAAGTELGPMLAITQRVSVWADGPAEAHRLALTWTLTPAARPDAGVDADAGPPDSGAPEAAKPYIERSE